MTEAAWDDRREVVVDQPLADALERRGVRGVHAGDHVRLQVHHGEHEGMPPFFGSFASGEGDLSERVDDIVRATIVPSPRPE